MSYWHFAIHKWLSEWPLKYCYAKCEAHSKPLENSAPLSNHTSDNNIFIDIGNQNFTLHPLLPLTHTYHVLSFSSASVFREAHMLQKLLNGLVSMQTSVNTSIPFPERAIGSSLYSHDKLGTWPILFVPYPQSQKLNLVSSSVGLKWKERGVNPCLSTLFIACWWHMWWAGSSSGLIPLETTEQPSIIEPDLIDMAPEKPDLSTVVAVWQCPCSLVAWWMRYWIMQLQHTYKDAFQSTICIS